MKRIDKKIFSIILLSIFFILPAFSMEKAFYILRPSAPSNIGKSQDSIASLQEHYQSIDILIAQAYQLDEKGLVWGLVDPELMDFAKNQGIKIMPLVTNAGFNKEKVHKFLLSPQAQQKAINSIVEACKRYQYYGVQLDFEMVPLEDRDALTKFFSEAARALHKEKFVVSYAVAPIVEDQLHSSFFLKRMYEIWEGVYDLKALGQSGDFISIMAYGQHGSATTPGPTASFPWVEATAKYALKKVPPQKVSLGIPTFSNYWYTSKKQVGSSEKIAMLMTDIGYKKVEYLLKKYHASLIWNDQEKINYAMYEHDWLNEYIFVEDEKSFKTKLDLVKKYKLRGISVFDIGLEDPRIWKDL